MCGSIFAYVKASRNRRQCGCVSDAGAAPPHRGPTSARPQRWSIFTKHGDSKKSRSVFASFKAFRRILRCGDTSEPPAHAPELKPPETETPYEYLHRLHGQRAPENISSPTEVRNESVPVVVATSNDIPCRASCQQAHTHLSRRQHRSGPADASTSTAPRREVFPTEESPTDVVDIIHETELYQYY